MRTVEPDLTDWDLIIQRAQDGEPVEDKLARTIELLGTAIQRGRLRGDATQIAELRLRLDHVHALLDRL